MLGEHFFGMAAGGWPSAALAGLILLGIALAAVLIGNGYRDFAVEAAGPAQGGIQ